MYTDEQKKKINQYRKENPQCVFCVFYYRNLENGQVWDMCDLRRQKIFQNKALRCDYYELKKE